VTNEQDFDSIKLVETIQATFDHLIRKNPMGEARKDALRLDFDRKLKLEFHGTKVTSDKPGGRPFLCASIIRDKILLIKRGYAEAHFPSIIVKS